MNKLDNFDQKIIKKFVKQNNKCQLVNQTNIKNTKKIHIPRKKYIDGFKMSELQCIFKNIILNHVKDKQLLKDIIKSITQQDVKTSQGHIFISKLLNNNQIVMKQSLKKDKEYNFELLKEYFIGMHLNNLRFHIPNFMYTFGIINCSKPIMNKNKMIVKDFCTKETNKYNFLLLEKIIGNTFNIYLQNNTITLNNFKNIVCQFLISLEVAQQQYKYSHNDLHLNNIILRKKKHTYNVSLNNLIYNVQTKYILTIIDYGHSSIEYKTNKGNIYIGGRHYNHGGIKPFLVPGFDMYRFLVSCLFNCLQNTFTVNYDIIRFIKIIFTKFYKNRDPYNIFYKNRLDINNLYAAIDHNTSQVKSIIMKYTPKDMLDFLVKNKLTSGLNVKLKNPKNLVKLKVSNSDNLLYNEYNIFRDNTEIDIKYIFKYFLDQDLIPSYIHRSYVKYMLTKIYNKNKSTNKKLLNDIINIQSPKNMISYDLKILSNIKVIVYYMNLCYEYLDKFKFIDKLYVSNSLNDTKVYNTLKQIFNEKNINILKKYKFLYKNLEKNLKIVYTYNELVAHKSRFDRIKEFTLFLNSSVYKNIDETIHNFKKNYLWIETIIKNIFNYYEKKSMKKKDDKIEYFKIIFQFFDLDTSILS